MTTKKKHLSSSLARGIRFYPSPHLRNLFLAYVEDNGMTQSEAASVMVRDFFRVMPEYHKKRYEELVRSMQDKISRPS